MLQAIHPSTAKLIRRLADMTANRQLDWQEVDQSGVQLAVADYHVLIRLDPVSLVITTLAGEELERVDSDQLQAMSAPDFESYAQLLTVLHSNALRTARNVESAVQDMLEELDADEAPPASVELGDEIETAEDLSLDALHEADATEAVSDFEEAAPTAEAAWPSDDPFTADAEEEADGPSDASRSSGVEIVMDEDVSKEHEIPFVTGVLGDFSGSSTDEKTETDGHEDAGVAADESEPQLEARESASLDVKEFMRREVENWPSSDALEETVEADDSDQGFDVVEHLERFEDDPFSVGSGPVADAEPPAAPAPSVDAIAPAPTAPAADSAAAQALSLEEMQFVQTRSAESASSVVFGGFGAPPERVRDDVECSVFAPRAASAGKLVQIQLFLHTLEESQRKAAELTAEKIDALASLRSRKALSLSLAQGAPVQVLLTADDAETRQSFDLASPMSEQTVWHGTPTSVSFFCRVDGFASLRNHVLKCLVSVEGVPVGEFKFTVEVTPMSDAADAAASDLTEPDAEKYSSVFLSYAREDKDEVDRVARVYNTMGMTVHRDISSLQPGEVFEDQLMSMLRNSDAFVLIWSQNAQNSEAVRTEVQEALRVEQSGGKPRFLPFPIEGPPIPMPWPEFADRHIGDPIYHRG